MSEVNSGGKVLRRFVDVNEPDYLSVDRQGRVLVANWANHRIVQLNCQRDESKLQLECVLIDGKDTFVIDDTGNVVEMTRPERFYHNELTSRLYVIHNCNRICSLFAISYPE